MKGSSSSAQNKILKFKNNVLISQKRLIKLRTPQENYGCK